MSTATRSAAETGISARPPETPVDARVLSAYLLRLGATGFGGPIALAGRMHRDLVEERGWITDGEYREGLALAQLAPGPLAAQLAIYLGWVRGGARGATMAGVAFVAPSLLMVLALSWLYVRLGGTDWLQHAFYGVGAGVIAIIARSATRLARTTLGGDALLWGVFAVNAAVTAWTQAEWLALVAGSGALVLAVRTPWRQGRAAAALGAPVGVSLLPSIAPVPLAAAAAAAAPGLLDVFWFFTKAGLVVFGSGLAIVPFLYGGVVEGHGWLTERQFVDAVAVSVLTPGPVVITVAFIGYLTTGLGGALAASAGVFLPTWLVVVAVAPRFHRVAGSARARAFVDGVTAAASGALAGAVVVLGLRAIVDVPSALLGLASLAALAAWRRASEPVVLLAAGVVGVLLRTSG